MSEYKIRALFSSLGINVNNITKVKTFANLLFKVETNQGNYFLKIFEKEEETGYKLANLYPLLSKNNVPVPEVVKYDDSLKLISSPYLIIREIEGEMLCDVINKMSDEEKKYFYYNFGQLIGRIHSITFDQFGETFDGKNVTKCSESNNKGPFSSWKEMHKEIIKYRLSFFEGSDFSDLIEPISSWFKKNETLIDYDIVPRLLHLDLNQKNIFIRDNRISGIIDFDGAFIGHNEEELMRIEGANFSNKEDLKQSFFKGYTEIIRLDDNYEKRRKYYYLSRLLVHINCMIKFGQSYVDVEKEKEIVRKEICKLLNDKPVDFDKNK